MTAAELQALADELGLDAIGAAPAAPYLETEHHIRERRDRGLFGGMRFTMARPEISCHPELLLDGARTVVSAALCYYAEGPEPGPGEGRLARYCWDDPYAVLRDRLSIVGDRLGGAYRVLVDDNAHVDREAAARAGLGFYGKNTLLITRRHGSWVVLGTLVTEAEIEPSAPVAPGCGDCRLCVDACPTGALDEPGVLDATRCIAYWLQSATSIPEDVMEATGDRLYGCDTCQDVCPWNRGVERRRRGIQAPESATSTQRLADWLERDSDELVAELERLFVPRNDARWLRRNALLAAGNTGDLAVRPLVEAHADDEDEVLRETARWALDRIGETA